MKNITQERLRSLLHYDSETGIFTYLQDGLHKKKGETAGYVGRNGYRAVKLDAQIYYAHRLAFLYMTGSFPENHVDHINHVRTDNRWCNLRPVTQAENNRNASKRKDNTSGYTGVSLSKGTMKWTASCSINGKRKQLGTFENKEDAAAAVAAAKLVHYGLPVAPNTTTIKVG